MNQNNLYEDETYLYYCLFIRYDLLRCCVNHGKFFIMAINKRTVLNWSLCKIG